MPQFQVPQFIETEDKVVGPLTLKQFGYIGVVGLISFFLYFILTPFLWLFITAVLAAIAIGLAFGKVNGRPIIAFVVAFIQSVWSPKVYVFRPSTAKRAVESIPRAEPTPTSTTQTPKKPLFGGIRGLRDWIATSKSAIPRRERPLPKNFGRPQEEFKDRYEVIRKMSGEREKVKRVDFR